MQAATGLLLVYFVGHGVAVDNQLNPTHSGSRAPELLADIATRLCESTHWGAWQIR